MKDVPNRQTMLVPGHQLLRTKSIGDFSIQKHTFCRPSIIPWHSHELPVVVAVLQGGYQQRTRHTDFFCGRGDIVAMPDDEHHCERIGPSGATGLLVWCPPETLAAATNPVGSYKSAQLAQLAHRIHREMSALDAYALLSLEGILLQLVAEVGRAQSVPRTRVDSPWVLQAESLLRSSSSKNWSLAEVASAVGVSRSHLARGFRERFGCSVGEFLRICRLERAAEQIKSSDKSLAQVAAENGFYDQSHFARLFRRHFGCTPSQYRGDRS